MSTQQMENGWGDNGINGAIDFDRLLFNRPTETLIAVMREQLSKELKVRRLEWHLNFPKSLRDKVV
jgi:hypothetical protein